jgi:hypothetical protein
MYYLLREYVSMYYRWLSRERVVTMTMVDWRVDDLMMCSRQHSQWSVLSVSAPRRLTPQHNQCNKGTGVPPPKHSPPPPPPSSVQGDKVRCALQLQSIDGDREGETGRKETKVNGAGYLPSHHECTNLSCYQLQEFCSWSHSITNERIDMGSMCKGRSPAPSHPYTAWSVMVVVVRNGCGLFRWLNYNHAFV